MRAGFTTQAHCETCEVYLCAIPEACLGGRSAFEYWHTKVKLGKHGSMAGADEAAASQAGADEVAAFHVDRLRAEAATASANGLHSCRVGPGPGKRLSVGEE